MKGSVLDLADVVHAQIPKERERGKERKRPEVSRSHQSINWCKKLLDKVILQIFHNAIHHYKIGRYVRREGRWLDIVAGGQKRRQRVVELKLSPMNHFWAAAISCLSRGPSLFQMSHSTFTAI